MQTVGKLVAAYIKHHNDVASAKLKLHENYRYDNRKKFCDRCATPYVESDGAVQSIAVCGKTTHKFVDRGACTKIIACGRPWCQLDTAPICTSCNTIICNGYDGGSTCDLCDVSVCTDCTVCCDGCADFLCPVCVQPCESSNTACAPCVLYWKLLDRDAGNHHHAYAMANTKRDEIRDSFRLGRK